MIAVADLDNEDPEYKLRFSIGDIAAINGDKITLKWYVYKGYRGLGGGVNDPDGCVQSSINTGARCDSRRQRERLELSIDVDDDGVHSVGIKGLG